MIGIRASVPVIAGSSVGSGHVLALTGPIASVCRASVVIITLPIVGTPDHDHRRAAAFSGRTITLTLAVIYTID